MADHIDDMAEIHRIIFETPDSSDDFFSSWSDYSESESAAMPRGFEQRELDSSSTSSIGWKTPPTTKSCSAKPTYRVECN